MKKLAVLAAIATITSVNAGELNFQGRFDYTNLKSKTSGVETSSGQYGISFLRLSGSTKISDTLTGKLVLDLTDLDDTSEQSGVTKTIDRAYITKKFDHGFSLSLGKQWLLIGGRENYYSSKDTYSISKFNDATPSNLVGAHLEYEVAGQSFVLQHMEGETSSLKDKKATGITYYGNFMDNMIAPAISYHKVGTDRAGKYDVFTAVGSQFNFQSIMFELDYLMLTQENATDKELKSIVAHVRYNHDMWKPFVKYIKEDGEGSFDMGNGVNARETERTAMELGLEVVPNKAEDFRYHVVYSSAEKKNSVGTVSKVEDKTITAGIAFGMDLLK